MKPQVSFQLTSRDIQHSQPIDPSFAEYGKSSAPDLSWSGIPEQTVDMVLMCYDPDALPIAKKVWVHWLVSNIDPSTNPCALTTEYVTLKNDFKNARYDGPMPPPGTGIHHYHFKLYALSQKSSLDSGAISGYQQVIDMITPILIAETEIIGTFERK